MGIDPRIRARRVAVRRAEGRRRLRLVFVALGLVCVAAAAWAISRSALLDLDHVRVDGVIGSRLGDVEDAVDLDPGTPLFDLDLGSVETAVEALPWVADAGVAREWPGTVRVRVEPRVPVAQLGALPDNRFLVDASGVLTALAPTNSGLPLIAVEPTVTLGAVDPAAVAGVGIAMALTDDLLVWVEGVTIAPEPGADGRPIVGLDLIGSAVVELGAPDLIDDKLAALRAVLEGTELTCIATIDVAVPDLTTVTRDPVCDGTAPESGAADDG